jgi:regulator of sirC expression with transglutaminase-like and TPR domain
VVAAVSHLSHTQQVEARERFEQLAALPPSEIPLAEMALWIAAESRPEVDVDYWLGELAALAERIRPHCAVATSDVDRVDILNRVLFSTEVLETRKGIPITLAIIYLDVAQKVGLLSAGVGFPGHFLVKVYADSRELIVDPFFGKLLSPTECGDRLKQVIGKHVDLKPKMLKTVSTIEILQRVLRNLKLLHVSRKEYEEALACSERILLLSGDDPMELRDRGLIYRELGCAGPALADLELYLAHAPSDPQSLPLTEILRDLRVRARRVH